MTKTIILKKNEDHRIVKGHLWAFSNEIAKIDGEPLAGDIVTLRSHAGVFLGTGFYNPHSLIAVRLLTRHEGEEIDFQFFRKRIETALALRTKLYPASGMFRLIHGESDFLPGLIVDKYNDYLSLQSFSTGMERRMTLICDVLESLLHPKGIIERNEQLIRTLEGLEQRKGILRGSLAPVTVDEDGIRYEVNLLEGQKTGFFLDQRENRRAIRRFAKDADVLDCFCNEGGFTLHAAAGGASHVTAVDISEPTIERARKNATLNRAEKQTEFIVQDAFEYLKEAVDKKRLFDVVILDPPSFAKNKKSLVKARRGYKEIHTAAFNLLKPGGILATASCSYHMFEETFLTLIDECAHATGRNISVLEWHGAAPDHPVLPSMPETRYLKFGIFHVE